MRGPPHAISAEHGAAVERLSGDPFSSLVALKALALYPDACRTTTLFDGRRWACLTELDIGASVWDRKAYPSRKTVVLLDGNDEELLRAAFDRARQDAAVFKVHDPVTRTLAAALPGSDHTCAYRSYTTSAGYRAPESLEHRVSTGTEPADELLACFADGGYSAGEIGEHLRRGAAWFALAVDGRPASVCFVFPNFGRIWEVAGVYTVPGHRRKGYARAVVSAAVNVLCEKGRAPRYQLREGNVGSQAVAESLGLHLALTVDHYATPGVPGATKR
jgi:GNAT superfamily N-acetyltransferase